jgi:hypothetical protein
MRGPTLRDRSFFCQLGPRPDNCESTQPGSLTILPIEEMETDRPLRRQIIGLLLLGRQSCDFAHDNGHRHGHGLSRLLCKPVATMVAAGVADPIVTNLVAEDKVPWYRKPNLRVMYMSLFFCCMGVEMTSGFDSQLINVLQFSPSFNACKAPL